MPAVQSAKELPALPGQVVLVLQGGGALGAYQGGVYQALHEAKIEPDWVIGTSIGALNGRTGIMDARHQPSRVGYLIGLPMFDLSSHESAHEGEDHAPH
jgi:hypothetical protein